MKKELKMASWILFLIGILGGAGIGLLEGTGIWTTVPEIIGIILVIVGAGIGLLNISNKEATPFMLATIIVGGGAVALTVIPSIGDVISSTFARIAQVAVPAGVVVALITIYQKAKN